MPLADSSYPLLSIFWTMLEFFLWVIWIWILIMVFIDIFRSHDLSGWAKALWFLFVLFIPLIGVLVYLIARGGKMHERAARQARQQDAEARAYIQQAAASSSPLRSSSARRPRSWRHDPGSYRDSMCGQVARRTPSSFARAGGLCAPRGGSYGTGCQW